jgi:hypothetical protein
VTADGKDAYAGLEHLPGLVPAAVQPVRAQGFGNSCLPEHGELLRVPACETGTGCGVGLAWLAAGAHQNAQMVGVERDAEQRRPVGRALPRMRQHRGRRRRLAAAARIRTLRLLVMDDFGPLTGWPPRFGDGVDAARLHWLEHPLLCATQVPVTREWSTRRDDRGLVRRGPFREAWAKAFEA